MLEGAVDQLAHVRVGEPVVDVLALAPTRDDAFGAEQSQLLRDRGEAHARGFGELGHTPLALGEPIEQTQTRYVTGRAKERGGPLECVVVQKRTSSGTRGVFARLALGIGMQAGTNMDVGILRFQNGQA